MPKDDVKGPQTVRPRGRAAVQESGGTVIREAGGEHPLHSNAGSVRGGGGLVEYR